MSPRVRVFVLFTSAYFMSYFYRSTNAVIAPDLVADVGLSAAQLGLMTSLFFAAFAAMQIPLGIGLDRWGPRWVTPILMMSTVAGSVVFAVATAFGGLALGRALIGAGMAGVLMGSLKMFSQWFPAKRFATVSGLLVGIGSFGALFAATPLAWLNQTIGWRNVFLVGAVLTALFAVAIMLWTRNTPPGVAWTGGSDQQGSLRDVAGNAHIWRIIPITFFVAGTLMSFQGLWAGPYLFDIYGLDKIGAGNVLLALGVGTTFGFGGSGWACDRFGLARTMAVVSAVFVASQFALALRPPLAMVAVLYFIFGLTGGFNVMFMAQARTLFPLAMTGKAVTFVNLFGIGGTFLLQWFIGLLIGLFPADTSGHYPPVAYTTVLLVTATGALLSLLWYVPMTRVAQAAAAD